jgi:hypothetical protein
MSSYNRAALTAMTLLFATSACAGTQANLPSNGSSGFATRTTGVGAAVMNPDTTSILKELKRSVVIGSTVDPSNGDKAPRAISVATASHGLLKEGQLLVCNFDDKSGTAGTGTTMELLDPKVGSKPTRFVQSSTIDGCDGDAITHSFDIYGSGITGATVDEFSSAGKLLRTYKGSIFKAPFDDAFANAQSAYAPAYVYSSDAELGTIISISEGFYGDGKAIQVANGFAVNKSGPSGDLGPSGLQYNKKVDTLYIADGVTDTVVEFQNASNLLEPDEITVGSSGKTFKCKHPDVTCGKLVYAGSDVKAPMAMALLPNGNLIVANTGGTANTLVELTTTGQVLDTRVVDSSSTQGVFGIVATGTTDANTALFFTDTNDNSVHELEK